MRTQSDTTGLTPRQRRGLLRRLVRDLFLQRSLVIASNRGPLTLERSKAGKVRRRRGTGGVVSAVSAIGLTEMGLANEIIQLAFGLLLAALAVAVALAFGLGGREVAAREIEGWLESVRSKE